MQKDPHRPQYHFLPPANWMNDPNGLIQWQDKYHMFYQYNPNGAFHGTIHWGHAVSKDLVHWEHLPIALTPTPGGPDSDGCWSGYTVNNNGAPTLVYSGLQQNLPYQVPCLATGSEDLLTWQKYPNNPVIPTPPSDLNIRVFRDHCVWRADDTWYQLIGGGIRDGGGVVLLYQSTDLIHWDYLHPLLVGDKDQVDPFWMGTTWECPDFFPLGDKHVLLISVRDEDRQRVLYSAYFVGTYANYKFMPETVRMLDFGGISFYAPQTFLDNHNRRIMFGWITEGRSNAAQLEAGWSGVMSLPRLLSLNPTGELSVKPAPALQVLRGKHHHFEDIELAPTSPPILNDVRGDSLEIMAEFEPGEAARFGLKVRCSPGGEEETLIIYDQGGGHLVVDRQKSSLSLDVDREMNEGPFELAGGETLKLHIFLDRSVIEIFANDRICLTSRVYPTRPDSLGVDLFIQNGAVKLKSLNIWDMRSIWPD